jgi:Ca-activated chloride channel family protein
MTELFDSLETWVNGLLAPYDLTLQAPAFLLLLLLVPLLVLVLRFTLTDLPRWQQWASVLLRSLLVMLLMLALTRPSHVTRSQSVATVYLVDVSQSIPEESLRKAHEWVSQSLRARGEHHAEVVTFAAEPRRVEIPKEAVALPPFTRPATGTKESDLQAAVQFGFGLFPPGKLRRMVLVSDGHETRGHLLAAAQAARDYGVKLYTQAFEAPAEREMLLRGVHLPEKVHRGSPFKVRVEIFSNHEGSAQLTVFRDGVLESGFPRQVRLAQGTTDVVFQSQVKEAGHAQYQVKLIPPAGSDRFLGNNEYTETVYVSGKPRVLLVEGGHRREASYLEGALSREKFDVEVRGRHGVPDSLTDLDRFDAVIYSDLPAFDQRETYVGRRHLAALKSYIRRGGGFIMAGGVNAFGPGGHGSTVMEELLPVRFDVEKKKDTPTLALMLIIDKSGSMGGLKIELTKQAARATVNLLGPQDQVGVVAFDSAAYPLVRLQSAQNKARIDAEIARLIASGGTSIFPALELAYQELAATRAKVKHAILLTDGQASRQGIPELVQNMAAENITVSTIAVGSDADRALCKLIADLGGGRSYFTADAYNIPKIFTKETTTVTRSAVVDLPFRPRVVKPAEALKGLDFASGPYLLGYVATKAKPEAELLLVSDYGEPLLARWRYGLGKAVAWTSDIKNRWAQEWLTWSGYPRFWSQLVRDVMKRKLHETFDLRARVFNGRAHVVVDAVSKSELFVNGLESTLTVTDPNKKKRTLPLRQLAPGRYEAEFPVEGFGAYVLEASHRLEGKLVAKSHGGFANPFPLEYLSVGINRALLERAAAQAHGRFGPTPEEPFRTEGEELVARREELWPFFLYLAIGIFLLDVFFRRVRLGRLKPVRV